MAIYDPERAQNTKDMADFSELLCFDHNFLPNAVIILIFWPVIYNFLNRSIDIFVDHILGAIWVINDHSRVGTSQMSSELTFMFLESGEQGELAQIGC